MTPEQLVPTLETCKRLKEAGWEKSTVFSYQKDLKYNTDNWEVEHSCFSLTEHLRIPAPTLQELLEELRAGLDVENEQIIVSSDINGLFAVRFETSVANKDEIFIRQNPAEAAALLWLELHEEW